MSTNRDGMPFSNPLMRYGLTLFRNSEEVESESAIRFGAGDFGYISANESSSLRISAIRCSSDDVAYHRQLRTLCPE
jgi:hypothetical protein